MVDMSEMLARGKRIDNDEWVEGCIVVKRDLLLEISYCFILSQSEKQSFLTWHMVDPRTVGRFTGLTDKNAKKIFEDDLCDMSILGADHELQKIVIRNSAVGFEPVHPDEVHPDDRDWKSFWKSEEQEMWDPEYFTIIGNIHDNPELLGHGS